MQGEAATGGILRTRGAGRDCLTVAPSQQENDSGHCSLNSLEVQIQAGKTD